MLFARGHLNLYLSSLFPIYPSLFRFVHSSSLSPLPSRPILSLSLSPVGLCLLMFDRCGTRAGRKDRKNRGEMERKRKQVEVVVGGEFLCLSCIDSLLFNLPEKDLPAGVSDIFERYPQIFEFQNRDRGKGEEGISVVLRRWWRIFSRFFPLSRVLSRLADSSPTGNGGGSGCNRTHNSHEIRPVYIGEGRSLSLLSSPRAYATRAGTFCMRKKNEVSSANCGGTLGSRAEDSRLL